MSTVIDFEIDHAKLIQQIPVPKPDECVVREPAMAQCTGKVEAWFNPSVALINGKYRMLYRAEAKPWFRTARICYCELNDDFQPIPETNRVLPLKSKAGKLFAEDPRWVQFGETWLCAFTDSWDMALAAFDDQFNVKDQWYLERPKLISPPELVSEKNWAFFESGGEMYCTYKVFPHIVLKILGTKANVAHTIDRSPSSRFAQYKGMYGEPRGGSSPIYHNGLMYHFFHSSHAHSMGRYGKMKRYEVSLVTFDPDPPFRLVDFTPVPLVSADDTAMYPDDRPSQHLVKFVCGASRVNDGWWLSYGHHDYRCRMTYIPDTKIERSLKAVYG